MGRIIVEYNPPLSEVVQKIVRNEVTASMISNDETSFQYDITMIIDCLEEVVKQDLEEVDVVNELNLIRGFEEEGVHYLEF